MDINNILMEQLVAGNPEMKPIMEAMQQQKLNDREKRSNRRQLRQDNKKLTLALKREISKNKSMIQENELLQNNILFLEQINDDLAAALGACPDCWGTIKDCKVCNGEGQPAAFPVNRKTFIKYVLPVIKNTPWMYQVFIEANSKIK